MLNSFVKVLRVSRRSAAHRPISSHFTTRIMGSNFKPSCMPSSMRFNLSATQFSIPSQTRSWWSKPDTKTETETPSASTHTANTNESNAPPTSSTPSPSPSATSTPSSSSSPSASSSTAAPSTSASETDKKLAELSEKLKKAEEQIKLLTEKDKAVTEKQKERERQMAQIQDQYLRVNSEIENVRRVAREDVAKAQKFGTQSFAKSLLTVVDEMALSLKNFPADEAARAQDERLKSVHEGLLLIQRSLNKVLEQNGVTQITALNERFNPNLHDAIFQINTPDQESDIVAQVLKEGFMINDRVLRPATVGVTKGKPRAVQSPPSPSTSATPSESTPSGSAEPPRAAGTSQQSAQQSAHA